MTFCSGQPYTLSQTAHSSPPSNTRATPQQATMSSKPPSCLSFVINHVGHKFETYIEDHHPKATQLWNDIVSRISTRLSSRHPRSTWDIFAHSTQGGRAFSKRVTIQPPYGTQTGYRATKMEEPENPNTRRYRQLHRRRSSNVMASHFTRDEHDTCLSRSTYLTGTGRLSQSGYRLSHRPLANTKLYQKSTRQRSSRTADVAPCPRMRLNSYVAPQNQPPTHHRSRPRWVHKCHENHKSYQAHTTPEDYGAHGTSKNDGSHLYSRNHRSPTTRRSSVDTNRGRLEGHTVRGLDDTSPSVFSDRPRSQPARNSTFSVSRRGPELSALKTDSYSRRTDLRRRKPYKQQSDTQPVSRFVSVDTPSDRTRTHHSRSTRQDKQSKCTRSAPKRNERTRGDIEAGFSDYPVVGRIM